MNSLVLPKRDFRELPQLGAGARRKQRFGKTAGGGGRFKPGENAMFRRTFVAAIAGLCAWRRRRPQEPDVNSRGAALARVFRLEPDGTWQRIARADQKPGDRCIMLGVNDDRLWRALIYTVGEQGYIRLPSGDGVAGEQDCDLLSEVRDEA